MYSWGDDTNVSVNRGGYDYDSVRQTYDPGRGYANNNNSLRNNNRGSIYSGPSVIVSGYNNDPKSKVLHTNSEHPLVISLDLTGSMGSWRDVFFDKMPLLWSDNEGIVKYFKDAELSLSAIGDVDDTKALEVCDFAKGSSLDQMIASLNRKGGAGNAVECYDLAAYFYLNKCDMPKAKKPLMFIAGDEGFYNSLERDRTSRYLGIDISENIAGKDLFNQLKTKFEVYILRKDCTDSYSSDVERRVRDQWQSIFGEKMIMLEEPKRIIDTILGIVAINAGEFDSYANLLSKRQTPGQVRQVMNSIRHLSVQATPDQLYQGTSLRKLPPGKKSPKLGD